MRVQANETEHQAKLINVLNIIQSHEEFIGTETYEASNIRANKLRKHVSFMIDELKMKYKWAKIQVLNEI